MIVNGNWKLQFDNKTKRYLPFLLILLGMVSGTVLANVLYHYDSTLLQPFIMDQYYADAILNYRRSPVAWRILPARSVEVIGCFLAYYVFRIVFLGYLIITLLSFFWGFLITIEILRLGIHGLLTGGICLFPHMFLYGLAVYMTCVSGEQASPRRILLPILLTLAAIGTEVWLEPQMILRFLP